MNNSSTVTNGGINKKRGACPAEVSQLDDVITVNYNNGNTAKAD